MKLIDADALLAGLYDEAPKDVAMYIANFPEAQLSGEGTTNTTTNTTCGTTDDCIRLSQEIWAKVCKITDTEGLQHEVIHYGDLKIVLQEVTGWMI